VTPRGKSKIGEPLAAIKDSRRGSSGSAKMAQFLAATNTELEVVDRVGIQAVTILDAGGPDGNLPTWIKIRQKHSDRVIVFMKPSFAKVKEKTFFTELVRDLEKAPRWVCRV
jgi:hypothetical protein